MAGYGRKIGAKTGAVTRKQNTFKNAQITLTNFDESVTIEERAKSFKSLLSGNGINLTIKQEKQSEHILGSTEWRRRLEEDLKSGKGEIIFRDKSRFIPLNSLRLMIMSARSGIAD